MIYVTMRDGRTIRYNEGTKWTWGDGNSLVIRKSDESPIARIALDLVERAEFTKPCAITDKHGKAIKVRY